MYPLGPIKIGMYFGAVLAPHSRILAWKIPWIEEPGRITVYRVLKSQTGLSTYTQLKF